MHVLLAIPVVVAVAFAYCLVEAVAPTNMLIAHMRGTWPSLIAPGVLSAVALLLVTSAHGISLAIARGAPDWLNLIVLILLWDAIKLGLLALREFVRVGLHSVGVTTRVTSRPARSAPHDHSLSSRARVA